MTDVDPLVGRRIPRRVTPPPQPQRRRHPAAGARIVALGVGASTMFGLVATMGIAHVRAESTPSSTGSTVAPAAPAASVSPTAPLTVVPVPALPSAGAIPVASRAAAPIVLEARPDVRVVTPAANVAANPAAPAAAPAPVATTRGSN